MELVLGIDLGTSFFKMGLFDKSGQMRGLGRQAVPTNTGDGSRAEVSVDDFWRILRQGVSEALQQASALPSDIKALSYSSQANTFVLLDASDAPLTPLILWTDMRADGDKPDDALLAHWSHEDYLHTTGIGIEPGPGFAIAKLRWIMKHDSDTWARVAKIMTISDYLVYSLTGTTVGDGGTAELTSVYDVPNRKWWAKALVNLGIPIEKLSTPLRPGSLAGSVTALGAERIGISPGAQMAVGSLDHHVAAIGTGAGTIAQLSESTGTVMAALACTDEYRTLPGCCTGPGIDHGTYYNLAFDTNGASVLQWYQETHAAEMSVADLVATAADVPAGADGLLARPNANQCKGFGGFRDMDDSHTPGHFARAIMESTVRTLGELVDNLSPHDRPAKIAATGGGAKSDLWLQMKADMIGAEFIRLTCPEPACMGAGMLGAVAAGWFDNIQSASGWIKIAKVFSPAR